MGKLVNGKWVAKEITPLTDKKGAYARRPCAFRGHVTTDGRSGFPPERGRYHLYVSYACPWAHRTLIIRQLKGLTDIISMSVVEPVVRQEGWEFGHDHPDRIGAHTRLYQVYQAASPHYTGGVTVPVLWDKHRRTIVNNESSDIMRIFNRDFGLFANNDYDFAPAELLTDIDEVNRYVYDHVNNGVYRVGFATTQAAYDEAFDVLFSALDTLEERLRDGQWLVGNRLTEADWRLFTTLLRFDPVYHLHFKCNRQKISEYPRLADYLRRLRTIPGVEATINMDHIKRHYYLSHRHLNPSGIVPRGPRDNFGPAAHPDLLKGRNPWPPSATPSPSSSPTPWSVSQP